MEIHLIINPKDLPRDILEKLLVVGCHDKTSASTIANEAVMEKVASQNSKLSSLRLQRQEDTTPRAFIPVKNKVKPDLANKK